MADRSSGRGHHPARAAPVAAQRQRRGFRKAGREPLHAGPRGPAKAVDALVVVPHHQQGAGRGGQQLHQPFLGQVGVLVFVYQQRLKVPPVARAQLGVGFEQADGLDQDVIEVQQPLAPAAPRVFLEKAGGGQQPRRLRVGRRSPAPGQQALQRDQLLLHALQDAQQRRHQVVGALLADQHRVPELPHQLPHRNPAFGAFQDPECRRDADRRPVLAQPAHGEGVEGAHVGRRLAIEHIGDPAPHLLGRALGEGEDQDAVGRDPLRHQTREAVGDDRRLARAGARHHPQRACRPSGSRLLLGAETH